MFKYRVTIIKAICFVSIFSFVWGCNNQTETPQPPKVVSKKIAASKPSDQKPEAGQQATRPAPMSQKQPIDSKPTVSPVQKPYTTPKATTLPPRQESDQPPKQLAPPVLPTTEEKAKISEVKMAETGEKEQPVPTTPAPEEEKQKDPQSFKLADIYDPSGKIDPFIPLYKEEPPVEKDKKEKKKKKRLPLTPLEKVDLSQLKLVGIIRAPSGNKALVEESSGKGYIVKIGTYMGIHAGRVTDILPDRLVVEEEVETTLGTYELQKRELKIQRPPGEM